MEAKKAEMGAMMEKNKAMMADMKALLEQFKKDGKLTPEQLKMVEDMQNKMAEHQAMMDQKMKDMAGMNQGTAQGQQKAAAPKHDQKVVTQPVNPGNNNQQNNPHNHG